MKNWISSNTEASDIVISSRIRIARNINATPFPHKLNIEDSKKIVSDVEEAFYKSLNNKEDFKTIRLWDIGVKEANGYLEKHIISQNLIKTRDKSAFILGKDETVSLMINEEDHIRLQCITSGLNIREAYALANNIDDKLEEKIDYAFDEKLGYMTACPTNLGTGLRASAMIHLPALTMNDEINGVLKALTQVGMTIRGLYGEGSKAEGNIYQVSNQITLGVNEEDIINNLEVIIAQLINQENMARELLIKKYKYELEDKMYRSLGILKNAVILTSREALDLISNVRMGIEMGIINNIDKSMLNELLVKTQPASLQLKVGRELSGRERDIERASLVRSYFNKE